MSALVDASVPVTLRSGVGRQKSILERLADLPEMPRRGPLVDPYGRVLAQTDIFRPAVVVGTVRFLQESTIYARVGDVFPYASAAITLTMLVFAGRRIQ